MKIRWRPVAGTLRSTRSQYSCPVLVLAPCSQAEALKEIFGDDDFMRRHKASVSGQKRRRLGTRLGAPVIRGAASIEPGG